MKKTNIILLIIVVLVGLISLIVYYSQNKDTARVYRDFAIEDTASINKIFLADKQGKTITLERKDGYWMVNNEYKARRDLIDILLTTIKNLEVTMPVPESKLDFVLRSIAAYGIKTEIYQNNKLVKTYYVGGAPENNIGTYMILEGSEVPFVVSIPGFSGFLTIRYNTEINEWREKIIFNYKIEDIYQVKIHYPDQPENSFIAVRNSATNYDLLNYDGSPVNFKFDTLKVKDYISRAKFFGFEAFILDSLQQFKRDSLLSQQMVFEMSVLDVNKNKKSFKAYYRQNIDKLLDDKGELYPYDIDRMYAIVDDKEVVLIQFYVVDQYTVKKDYFKK
ncbi:MAG TPA: DUF4340 domain-containing protein [Bacteroidales bacterium]|nr:DUF4340 domain-containing protein [Bacteroidales bacterium]HOL98403.1 DUF4340 domain-containing protein [Bacteroidales bacterium]HOM36699.1 DUF4340 domain-containing protein [Bacteroidales bacterium]HPD24168.1 DUF4340 domain-containing protein [Bacteroidales bacterium]HRT00155.1 DUF4340 domain-containing protein [Bacteroidales bacterium]